MLQILNLLRMHNTEGYADNVTINPYGPFYYYYHKDHLGNNREVWKAAYSINGTVTPAAVVQQTSYYPSGLPWSDGSGVSTQTYKYNGKEFVEMHGLDTYDYGARGDYPAMGRFMTVDPLAERNYSISPYAYCKGNPVKFIDPTGMLEELYITGTESEAAKKEFQKSTSLTLSKDDKTGKISATGDAKTLGDKKLLQEINDPTIKVEINATTSDKNIAVGGAFMGNTVSSDGTVVAQQEVNPNQLSKMSSANLAPGQDMLHEVTEAYEGAKISQASGVSSPNAGDPTSVYKSAHNLAVPQSGNVYLRVNDINGNQVQAPYTGGTEAVWSTTPYLASPVTIPRGLTPIKIIK